MKYIIIFIFILLIALLLFMNRYYKNMIVTMTKNIYNSMNQSDNDNRNDLSRLQVVESDDRMLRLIDYDKTNMTELGMAIEKSNVNVHRLDERHVGVFRKLMTKFNNMTDTLIANTNLIIPEDLEKNTDADIDVLRDFINHWTYYGIIYDKIWIHECREFSNLDKYRECHAYWKEYYKDKEREYLKHNLPEIIQKLNDALNNPERRVWAINYVKDKIN